MKKHFTFIAFGLALMAVVACAKAGATGLFASGSWRYKMTVTVETPEGEKTGYAVREVSVQKGLHLTPEMTPRIKLQGEAVVVDLGARGVLFALLKGYYIGADYGSDLPGYIFHRGKWLTDEGLRYMSTLKTPPQDLAPQWYPVMVRFKNIQDPKTVENLLTYKSCAPTAENNSGICPDQNHFEEAFGAGVKLKSVTIEMTDEDVTWGAVFQSIPWLREQTRGYLDGKPFGGGPELSNILSQIDFISGDKK